MKVKFDCPYAYHGNLMRVYCNKTKGLCLFQYYKNCKGWWVNSPQAAQCPIRRNDENAGSNTVSGNNSNGNS